MIRDEVLDALAEAGWESEDWTVNCDGDLVCEMDGGHWLLAEFSDWWTVTKVSGWYSQTADVESVRQLGIRMRAMEAAEEALDIVLADLGDR